MASILRKQSVNDIFLDQIIKTKSPNSAFAKNLRLLRVDLFLLVSLPPGIGAMLALEVTCRFGVQAGCPVTEIHLKLPR